MKEKEFRRTSPLTVCDKFHSLFSGNLLEFLSNTNSQYFQYFQKLAFSKLISFFVFSNLPTIDCIFLFSISVLCYGTLWTLTFFFSFYLFFLILYFFSFEFLFLFLFSDDEEACDVTVTWHVTWCNVISLEHSRKI